MGAEPTNPPTDSELGMSPRTKFLSQKPVRGTPSVDLPSIKSSKVLLFLHLEALNLPAIILIT